MVPECGVKMIPLLYSVATVLVGAGLAAVLFGADNIRAESGTAWLQSGATLAASGFLLVALTAVLGELRKVRRGLAEMTVEVQDLPPAPAPAFAPPVTVPMPEPAPAAELPPSVGDLQAQEAYDSERGHEHLSRHPVGEPASVVGTYAAGESTYVMYSDGTIEAEMGGSRYRFPSMAALRHFVETGEGGEKLDDLPPADASKAESAAAPHEPETNVEPRRA